MVNQQTGEVSFLHFDDGKLDLHQMFCLGALDRLKALKMQIDLKSDSSLCHLKPIYWRANYKN